MDPSPSAFLLPNEYTYLLFVGAFAINQLFNKSEFLGESLVKPSGESNKGGGAVNDDLAGISDPELPQDKRHRRDEESGGGNNTLPHGEKTPTTGE